MKRIYLYLFLFIGLARPWTSLGQYVRCDGKSFVDSSGQELLLRGVNLGGWLVPEGYILHMPGFGSPSSIHSLIEEVLGPARTDSFFVRYRRQYYTAADIQQIKAWGFNSVRLPFHYNLLTPADQPDVWLESGFAYLDQCLAWCAHYQVYLILDLHCAPGGQNAGNISDSDGTARLWLDTVLQDRTVAVWKKVAERYRGQKWILGYDLLNETVLPAGVSNLALRNLYIRISQAVRQVDDHHILFIEGSDWGNNFDQLSPPLLYGKNVAFSFHKYWNQTTATTIQSYLNLRNLYNVPLWLGEFGENSNVWIYNVIELMESNKISWCYWPLKKLDSQSVLLSAAIPGAYQQLLNYWNGSAPRPSADAAYAALLQMIDHVALARCTEHRDVRASLLNRTSRATAVPYMNHYLPGDIPAVAYDMGMAGNAYFETGMVQRDQYDQPWDWNQGGQWRNDAVDIGEAGSNEYYIGWISNGEWLQYTVQVDSSGLYDFSLRVAATSAVGRVTLAVDGQTIHGSLPVPNTSGYYNWKAIGPWPVTLTAGPHVLRLDFVSGGFNLERMYFDFKQATAVQHGQQPERPALQVAPVFPNPGNSQFIIKVTIVDNPGRITATVFNRLGQTIRSLTPTITGSDQCRFNWDGGDNAGVQMQSGVYFVRISGPSFSSVQKLSLVK